MRASLSASSRVPQPSFFKAADFDSTAPFEPLINH
jgi:hypothetical protein